MLHYTEVKDEILKYNRFINLEFIIGTKCQNACKYCYRVPYQNSGSFIDMSIEKMKMYYENSVEMGLISDKLESISVFGGDPIIDLDYFRSIVSEFKDKTHVIVIPTNGRVLESISDSEIDSLLEISDGKLKISLSVDGPINENTQRPLSNFGKMQGFKQERNWDRLIYLSKKYGWGFHPMFWFENVTTWFDTWKWFVDNDLTVYTLEVRHGHKDDDVLAEGVYMLAKIIEYCNLYNISNKFNSTNMSSTIRGLTCSALNTLYINSDGCAYFCHRVIEDQFKIADLVSKNINLNNYITLGAGFNFRNSASCLLCPIRHICPGPCIGMIDEYWDRRGCVSIPIPSMCKYYLLKNGYFIHRGYENWKNINITDDIHEAVFHNFGPKIYKTLDERLNNELLKM